jgi:hypothetical protein
MDALPPYGGPFSARSAAGFVLVAAACCLLAIAPADADAATGPASGTADLAAPAAPDDTFATAAGGPQGASAYVGDVNGGLQDIAIGVPTADPGGRVNAGSVYVLFGGGPRGSGRFGAIVTENLGPRGYRIDGAARGDRLGTSIARLGYDLGADGLSDFAVGAPRAGPGGIVYLVPGSNQPANVDLSGDDETSIVSLTGAPAGERAGEALYATPRSRRLFIGAPRADPGGLVDAGSVIVLNDLPEAAPASRAISLATMTGARLDGRVAGGLAGSAVAAALDFDGDTRSEVVVGAPRVSPGGSGSFAGEAYIVPFPRSPGTITLGGPADGGFVVAGEPGMSLGGSVTGLGDVSGDRLGDVAIGAATASPGGRDTAGSAIVVLSRRTPALPIPATAASGSVLRIDGAARFDRLGTVVAPANLDVARSARDLLVSAPGVDALGRANSGAIYALRGGDLAGGVDVASLGDAGVRFSGSRPEERTGTDVSTGGPKDYELAIFGGQAQTSVAGLGAPAAAPAAAPIVPSHVPGCAIARDIELVVDGSRGMADAVPFIRTAIDAMLTKPRSAPINLGAIQIGSRSRQVFPPLTVPASGYADQRDLATLRRLLDENVGADAGNPDYAVGLKAAVAARPVASALVLITDAAQPPGAMLTPPGRRLFVLQLGGPSAAPSATSLRVLAMSTGGAYVDGLDGASLPAQLALVEAGLTCEQKLTTRVSGGLTGAPAPTAIVETTLTPQRRSATFQTDLETQTNTATITFSFTPRATARRRTGAACVNASPVSLRGLRVIVEGRRVARLDAAQMQRALRGRRVALGRALATGRCGRGFFVVEISGLERLAGAQAQAAASSPHRQIGVPLRSNGSRKRVVKGVAVGSDKHKGRR